MKTTIQTILNHEDIQNKIRRIAYQIYESNVSENEIILAGVALNGYVIAERLKVILEEVSDIKCTLCKVTMNKTAPLGTVETSLDAKDYQDKSLILIDKKYPVKADYKGISLSTSLQERVKVRFKPGKDSAILE